MDDWQLTTLRLRLRRLSVSDRPALLGMLSDPRITRNLSRWPHPAQPEMIDALIARHQTDAPGGFAITYGDEFAGLISQGPRIGFMVAKPFWGLGIATEALAAVQTHALKTREALSAEVFMDNPASARVLEKCGWRETGAGESPCLARNATVAERHFVKCARYDLLEPLRTDRLTLRPASITDLVAIREIVSDRELADLLLWPWPFDEQTLIDRLTDAKARAGLVSAVVLDGTTIGRVSAGGGNIGFMFRRGYWGQGYATEAVSAKITQMFNDADVEILRAGAWEGNTASIHLLTKLGFVQTGWDTAFSHVRQADIEGPEFELTRETWEAKVQ